MMPTKGTEKKIMKENELSQQYEVESELKKKKK